MIITADEARLMGTELNIIMSNIENKAKCGFNEVSFARVFSEGITDQLEALNHEVVPYRLDDITYYTTISW